MKAFRDFTMTDWWFYFCFVILAVLISFGLSAQTKDEVWKYINNTDLKHKEIVFKQSILETGHFTSKICKENHNLFGMKYARQRPTLAIGEANGHAVYSSWRYSILDYLIFQDRYYKGGDYYEFLKSVGYATSKSYIKKLQSIK